MKLKFTNVFKTMLTCMLAWLAIAGVQAQTRIWGLTNTGGGPSTTYNQGTIFSMNAADGSDYKIEHHFVQDTAYPGINLAPQNTHLVALNGKFYSVTPNGGAKQGGNTYYSGGGVLYEYDAAQNIYKDVHDFDAVGGSQPKGSPTVVDGVLWGMTIDGGNLSSEPGGRGYGVIYSFNPATGEYTSVYQFDGTADHGQGTGGSLLYNPANHLLYGNSYGVFFSIDPTVGGSSFTKLASHKTSNLVLYNNKVYGMDETSIFSFDPATGNYKSLYTLPTGFSNVPVNPDGYSGAAICAVNNIMYAAIDNGSNTTIYFSFDLTAQTYTELYTASINDGFKCTDLLYYNGLLYGTCAQNGTNGGGTVFSLDPVSKVYTHLYDSYGDWQEMVGYFPAGITPSGNQLYIIFSGGGNGIGNANASNTPGAMGIFDLTSKTCSSLFQFNLNPGSANNPKTRLYNYNNKLYGVATNGGVGGGNTGAMLFSYDLVSGVYHDYDLYGSFTGTNPSNTVVGYRGKLYGLTAEGGNSPDDGGPGTGGGTLYEFDTATKKLTADYVFTWSKRHPAGQMVLINNLLYGVTSSGGDSGYGVIFSYDPATNTKTDLFSFPSTLTPYPTFVPSYGNLDGLVAYNGVLYGLLSGGANSKGAIFSFDPVSKTFTDIYDFNTVNGITYVPQSLIVNNNLLYGVCTNISKGYVFSLDPVTHAFTDIHDFNSDRLLGALVPYNGKLLGISLTGTNGQGAVYSLDPVAKTVTTLHNFTGDDGAKPTGLLLVKAIPTIGFSDITRTYGDKDTLIAATSTNTNVANPVTYTIGDPTIATFVNGKLHVLKAGTTIITASQAEDDGFSAVSVQKTLVVNKASLQVSAQPVQVTYGDPIPTSFTVAYSGFVNNEDASVVSGTPVFSTTANNSSHPGDYAVKVDVSGMSAANYALTPVAGKLTIVLAGISIQFNGIPATITYGDAPFDPAATASSGAAPVYTSNNNAVATITGDNKVQITGAGTATITVTFPATGTSSGGFKDAVITVAKKTLTIKVNDVYLLTGSPLPNFTATFNGLVNGDAATVISPVPVFSTTATSSSPAGTYPIIVSNIAALTAANYTVDPAYQQGKLIIGSIVFNGTDTRVYGATPYDAGATSSAGVQPAYSSNNPQVAAIVNNQVQVKGVGQASITASFPAAGGSPAQVATQLLTVQPAQLIVKATDTTRMYGQVNPVFRITYSGFVNGEDASVLLSQALASTTANTGSSPDVYPVTPYGAAASNYLFTYVKGMLTITAATQSIQFAPLPVTTIGEPDFALTASASSGLALSYSSSNPNVATVTNGIVHIVAAGSTVITASQAGNTNYLAAASQSQTLTLSTRATTISLDALPGKNYGDADFVLNATSSNTTIPVQYSSSNPNVATVANGMVHITGAGTTTITALQPATADYAAGSSAPKTLVVTPAVITVTAYNQTRYQGQGNAAFVINYSGFKNGDDSTKLGSMAMASTAADQNSPAGTYPINISGAAAGNYTFNYVPGVLTVLPAQPQSINFNTLPLERYGNADFDGGAIATSGMPVTYTSSDAKVATIVNGLIHLTGAGKTTITAAQAGGNGYGAAIPVSQVMTVEKGELVIQPDNVNINEGQTLPSFTLNYSGFVNGDNAAGLTTQPVVATTALKDASFGRYAISASGAAAANYNISYLPGVLTINATGDKVNAYCSGPTQITVTVFTNTVQKATLQLYSMGGQRILNQQVQLLKNVNSFTLYAGNVAGGIYVLKVQGEHFNYSQNIKIK